MLDPISGKIINAGLCIKQDLLHIVRPRTIYILGTAVTRRSVTAGGRSWDLRCCKERG
jgi:hypothetical protein